jgi:uncharacterized protein involved in exopolysaccharide biosynthesis
MEPFPSDMQRLTTQLEAIPATVAALRESHAPAAAQAEADRILASVSRQAEQAKARVPQDHPGIPALDSALAAVRRAVHPTAKR